MKIKKITAFIMALLCMCSFCSCKKTPQNTSSFYDGVKSESTDRNYITLLYSAADTFNPYTAKTDINRQLCKLLYEPLVKLDNEFNPIYSIASEIKTEGTKCVVTLKNVKFSDGTSVTADDVVYSCKLAKEQSPIYSAKLYEVSSVTAVNSSAVEFTLTKADPYFENLLDFPILKTGSEKITDSDSVLQPPVGSGRYKVSDNRQSLTVNSYYYTKMPSITTIKLINAPDRESVSHYVEIGAADMYYSEISDGNILRMSGKKLSMSLNNLVYIGINQNYGVLAENAMRQALASGIDREQICRNAYYNNALSATGFFNPLWDKTKSVQNIQITSDYEITVENLEKIGYNKLDDKSNRINSGGAQLKFTMLVNSENRLRVASAQLIAEQLKACGIQITVIEKSYEAYTECLKNGDFQLFLGEVKLTDNMDISSMVCSGGTAAFGLTAEKKTDETATADETEEQSENQAAAEEENRNAHKPQEVVEGFYLGQNTIADVATVLQTEMPFVPVCYRTGVLFCNDNIDNIENSSASDVFYSIENFVYKDNS